MRLAFAGIILVRVSNKALNDAISAVCLRLAADGPFAANDAALQVAQQLRAEDAEEWAAICENLAMRFIASSVRRFANRAARFNPDQYVIPGFEQAPAVIVVDDKPLPTLKCTPEQARAYLDWAESRLKGTLERCREDELAIKQLRKFIKAASPFCIKPGMTLEDGLHEREKHQKRRFVMGKKKSADARWGRTPNQ